MTREQKFFYQREAFRKFIAELNEHEVQSLAADCYVRIDYLSSIRPENIIKGLTLNTKDGKIPNN